MRSIGIQPDELLCRCEQPLPQSDRRKIALFTNVPEKAVISAIDVDIIYQLPQWLHAQKLDRDRHRQAAPDAKPVDLSEWDRTVEAAEHPHGEVNIAIVGKYVEHKDAYKSLGEALRHGGLKQRTRVNLRWVESEEIERRGAELLKDADGILVPGGFGKRRLRRQDCRGAATHASRRCRISASATACTRRSPTSRATSPAWKAPTPAKTIAVRRTRLSR